MTSLNRGGSQTIFSPVIKDKHFFTILDSKHVQPTLVIITGNEILVKILEIVLLFWDKLPWPRERECTDGKSTFAPLSLCLSCSYHCRAGGSSSRYRSRCHPTPHSPTLNVPFSFSPQTKRSTAANQLRHVAGKKNVRVLRVRTQRSILIHGVPSGVAMEQQQDR